MHKIGVISDTHGLLRPEVVKVLQGCEVILHGGDFDTEKVLDALEKIAPVHAVRGNNDYWDSHLPETLSIELYGVRFFIVHDKKGIPKDLTAYDIIIYGHSHKYEENYSGRKLLLNPGSCGPKRFTLPITLAILEISNDGTFQVERVDIEKSSANKKDIKIFKNWGRKEKQPSDLKHLIGLVIKDTEKGISVGKIAKRHGISLELVEQICRLYLTHPGVDADGIMRKMGL